MKDIKLKFITKNPKQVEAAKYWYDDTTDEILFGGGKGGGKSFLYATLLAMDSLTYPETSYFIARQSLNDLRKQFVPSMNEALQNIIKTSEMNCEVKDIVTFNAQDNFYKFYNGSTIYLLECKPIPSDPMFERFGSYQFTRGVIEEAGEVVELAKQNLKLTLGRKKNKEYNLRAKLGMSANPKKGWLKKEFIDPAVKGELPENKKFVRSLVTDNTYLTKEYMATLDKITNKVMRDRLFLGLWNYEDTAGQLLSDVALGEIYTNILPRVSQELSERFISCDVARFGKDLAVIFVWEQLNLIDYYVFEKCDVVELSQKILELAQKHRVPKGNIILDEIGVGGGAKDMLGNIIGFKSNATPLMVDGQIENFQQLKDQCAWMLADKINNNLINIGILPENIRAMVTQELENCLVQADPDKEGKKKIIPKEDMKLILNRSPDYFDTLLMRMFFEIGKKRYDTMGRTFAEEITNWRKDIRDRNGYGYGYGGSSELLDL